MRPCIECGYPSEGTRCLKHAREQAQHNRRRRTESGRDKPYNRAQWRRLTNRAREVQPWCSDCGRTEDLTTDHSSQSWAEYERTGIVPASTVTVLCRGCNTKRGRARGNNVKRND